MNKNNILIIGESCRDIFIYCNANRLCPDIPVPVLNVINQVENGGMAKNVHRNIEAHVKNCNLITNDDWYNVTKTRYMHNDSNHAFFRVDSSHDIRRIEVTNSLQSIISAYNIVVLSDYNKGFLLDEDIEKICSIHSNVFLDTKKILGKWANNAKFIKINHYEYECSKKYITDELEGKIIHTEGSNGCTYLGKNYPVDKVFVKDSSGAGDSFIAGLVIKYSQNSNIIESIKYANKCASKVVKYRGVTVI